MEKPKAIFNHEINIGSGLTQPTRGNWAVKGLKQ